MNELQLQQLKEKVFKANLALVEHDLIKLTWGNVSEIDRESNLIVIKPSGVDYAAMTAEDMVVIGLDGNKVHGDFNPSSDTPTHLAIYRAFPNVNGVVHTHSTFATAYAQAGVPIQPLGTTHGDYFYGTIPVTRDMTTEEINGEYELETGNVIVETFNNKQLDPINIPSVLVKNHGCFSFGKDSDNAVHNAVVLEEVAKISFLTNSIHNNLSNAPTMSQTLLDKHFLRKHGANAYYGQK